MIHTKNHQLLNKCHFFNAFMQFNSINDYFNHNNNDTQLKTIEMKYHAVLDHLLPVPV